MTLSVGMHFLCFFKFITVLVLDRNCFLCTLFFSDDCSMLYLYPENQLLFDSTVAFNVLCCFMHKSALLNSSIIYEESTSPEVPNMQVNGFSTSVWFDP